MLDAGTTSSPTLDLILDNTDTGVTTTGTWSASTTGSGYEGTDYLTHATSGLPAGGMTIDNGDANFHVTGTWNSSSAVSGYTGVDYHEHTPGAPTAGELIVDNGGSGYTSLGEWFTTTNVTGYYGSNYQVHAAQGLSYLAQIIDNTDPGFSVVGGWGTWTNTTQQQGTNYSYYRKFPEWLPPGTIYVDNNYAYGTQGASVTWYGGWGNYTTISGYWGPNYKWHYSWANTYFLWYPAIPATKTYDVYARWPAHSTYASNATYRIFHGVTSTLAIVSQRTNGGIFNYLGTFTMSPGDYIRLWGQANGNLVADAIALVPTDAGLPTATWQPTLSEEVEWEVYANWIQWSGHASNAPYTIFHKTGSTSVLANQQILGGQWNLLGTFTFQPNEDHRVELTNDQTDGSAIADAVAFVPVGAPPNTATWTPPGHDPG